VPPGTVRSGKFLRAVLSGGSCGKFLWEVLSVDPSGDGVPSGSALRLCVAVVK